MYKRILVAIDNSITAQKALDEAITLASALGASLCIASADKAVGNSLSSSSRVSGQRSCRARSGIHHVLQ
jgi:nucleotide-binding universal stress UspA family protein